MPSFTENLPNGTVGQLFSWTFSQSTADLWFRNSFPVVYPPYSFYPSTIDPFPAGMIIDPNGVFHGIPTVAGLLDVAVELRDSYPGPVPPYRAIISAVIANWRVRPSFVGGRVRRARFTPATQVAQTGAEGNKTYGF